MSGSNVADRTQIPFIHIGVVILTEVFTRYYPVLFDTVPCGPQQPVMANYPIMYISLLVITLCVAAVKMGTFHFWVRSVPTDRHYMTLYTVAYTMRVFEVDQVPPMSHTILLPVAGLLFVSYNHFFLLQIYQCVVIFLGKPLISYVMMLHASTNSNISFRDYVSNKPDLRLAFEHWMTIILPVVMFMFMARRVRLVKEFQEMRKTGTVLATMLDTFPVSVWATDKNLVVQLSRGYHLRYLGLAPDEIVGMSLGHYFDHKVKAEEHNKEKTIYGHLEVMKTGLPYSYQSVNKHPSGDITSQTILSPWRDFRGDLIGVIGMSIDITSDKARRQTEMTYESLVHTMNDNLIKIDKEFKILFMNRMLGSHTVDSTVGTNFIDLFKYDTELQLSVASRLSSLFETGKAFKFEWKIGNQHFSTSANPVTDDIDHNMVVAASVLTSDITERVISEQNFIMAQKAKIASQSKSNFIASMSHEIRNPLAAVLGSLQLLSFTPLSELQMEYCEDAIDHSKLLLEIINSVLDMSKIESDTLELINQPMSIVEIVQNTAEVSGAEAENKGLEFYTFISPALNGVQVLADRARTSQILSNFVNNALKFTESGYIYLSATLLDNTPDYVTIRFTCEDTGIGIKSTDISRVFEPFVQLRYDLDDVEVRSDPNEDSGAIVDVKHINEQVYYKYKGMGLGLAISKRLATLMGGDITVESQYKVGSQFSVVLKFQKINIQSNSEQCATTTQSKYNVAIVVHNGKDKVAHILQSYLDYMQVRDSFFVRDIQGLDEKLSQISGDRNHVAIIFTDYSAQLHNDYDSYSTRKNTKVLVLVTQSQQFDLLRTNQSFTFVTFIRKPLKLSKFISSLSERGTQAGGVVALFPKEVTNSKLMLVEDHPVNRKVITKMLNSIGFKSVVPAEDGQEALEILDRSESPFDLIIMDLQMPRMDGLTCTRVIKTRNDIHTKTPIVALTANAWSNSVAKCKGCGMQEVITKPTSTETLSQVLYKILSEKRGS